MTLSNEGDSYCKVKITFENENTRIFHLKPNGYRGNLSMSIYNQGEYINTLCNNTSTVFNESF
jgi:hypothetical protein